MTTQSPASADVTAFIEMGRKAPMWLLFCSGLDDQLVICVSTHDPLAEDRLHSDMVVQIMPGFLDEVVREVRRLGLLVEAEDIDEGIQRLSFRELPASTMRSPFPL